MKLFVKLYLRNSLPKSFRNSSFTLVFFFLLHGQHIGLRLSWSSYQLLLKLDGIRYNNATVLSLENSELLKQQNVSLDNNREMLTKEWLPQFMVKASQSKEDVSPIGDAFSTLSLRLKKHCKC